MVSCRFESRLHFSIRLSYTSSPPSIIHGAVLVTLAYRFRPAAACNDMISNSQCVYCTNSVLDEWNRPMRGGKEKNTNQITILQPQKLSLAHVFAHVLVFGCYAFAVGCSLWNVIRMCAWEMRGDDVVNGMGMLYLYTTLCRRLRKLFYWFDTSWHCVPFYFLFWDFFVL